MKRTLRVPTPETAFDRACHPGAEMPASGALTSSIHRTGGWTLVEMIVVMSFLGLFVLLAQMNLFGALARSRFQSHATAAAPSK